MRLPRIALVYSGRERPDTTGGHLLRAFQRLTDVVHFHPSVLSSVTEKDADLFLRVDDDLEYSWPQRLRPAGYWAIDTHMDYMARLRRSIPFDKVFCAQKSGTERLRGDGLDAAWLPLGCDPEFHGKCESNRELDICMVGFIPPGSPRADLVALLRSHFPRTFAGYHPFDALGQAYSRAYLGFNRSLRGELNMRVFEVMCAGTLLLTDPMDGMSDLFQDGAHLVSYAGPDDLCAKAHHYLECVKEREAIAGAGRAEVLEKHTYAHRAIEVLKAFDLWKAGKPRRPRQSKSAKTGEEAAVSETAETRSLGGKASDLNTPVDAQPPSPQIIRTGESLPSGQRPDVLELAPEGARYILDIGCSTGGLGEAIKDRARRAGGVAPVVVGVEVIERFSKAAEARLDAAIVGDVEILLRDHPEQLLAPIQVPESGLEAEPQRAASKKPAARSSRVRQSVSAPQQKRLFDCVIFADSLEHLRDPEAALRALRPLLAPEATVVLSIPNVRNREVFQKLAEGRWQYEEAGLLDRTHLRFFTRLDLEQTLFRSGYDIRRIAPKFTPDHQQWEALGRPSTLQFGKVTLTDLNPDEALEFFTYQWLVTAAPRQAVDYGLTSIIILTRNQLGYTQACVQSIRLHTAEPYELIFVDNGSTDGTPDYLKSLSNVTIVRNEENLGFPKGCNQGIAQARGQNILLLNNDTLASDGWLTRLLDALYSAPDVGAVGPRSHYASGQPLFYEAPPAPSYVDSFAWEVGRRNIGRRLPVKDVSGFCLLIRRSVLDAIGPLDEQYGIGLFEDNDLCRSIQQAGLRLLCACDAYVYHFGGRTFAAEDLDFDAQWKMAQQAYLAKWGSDEVTSFPAPLGGVALTLPLLPERPRISACIVARNAEKCIGECVDSVRPGVDEVIVIDAGSDDGTAEAAVDQGAHVERVPCPDNDVSAAREAALAYATGDWILWMEPEEQIRPECVSLLQDLVKPAREETGGYIFTIRPLDPETDEEAMLARQVRLFRRHEAIRFTYGLPEMAIVAVDRVGLQVVGASVELVSSRGADGLEDRQKIREQQLPPLRRECAERPEDAFLHYALGAALVSLGREEEALPVLQRSLELAVPSEQWLPRATASLIRASLHVRGASAALQTAVDGLQIYPEDPELRFLAGDVFRQLGKPTEARGCYERALGMTAEGDWIGSLPVGVLSYLTRHALARTLRDLGEKEAGENNLWRCVRETPFYAPAWLTLAQALRERGDIPGALQAVAQFLKRRPLDPEGLSLRGQMFLERGELAAARQDLALAVALRPADLQARHSLAHALLRLRLYAEAEQQLRGILVWEPADAVAVQNLISLLCETGQAEAAVLLLEDILRQRPEDLNVRRHLVKALQQMGDLRTAADHLARIAEVRPQDPQTLGELGDLWLRLGDRERARASWERVVQLDPAHPLTASVRALLEAGPAGINARTARNREGAALLERLYPSPAEKPDVAPHEHGWLNQGTAIALRGHLSEATQIVVELGVWLGRSTRLIAESAPNARIIAVDHWQGSSEHQENPEWRALLPTLYETFLVNCWDLVDRVIPVRLSTVEGLELIARLGIQADLIYIDASHDYASVCGDVRTVLRLFPEATLIGDDWGHESVQRAVVDTLRSLGLNRPFGYNAGAWWLECV